MIAVMNKGFVVWVEDSFGCVLKDFIYDASWIEKNNQFVPPSEKDFKLGPELWSSEVIFEEAYWMVLE